MSICMFIRILIQPIKVIHQIEADAVGKIPANLPRWRLGVPHLVAPNWLGTLKLTMAENKEPKNLEAVTVTLNSSKF